MQEVEVVQYIQEGETLQEVQEHLEPRVNICNFGEVKPHLQERAFLADRQEIIPGSAGNHPRISQEPGLDRIIPYGARVRA